MRKPHINLINRTWSALRALGPHLAIALLPGGLLILCVLLVVGRRNAISMTRQRHHMA